MDVLLSELFALLIFFGAIVLAKFKLLPIVTVILFLAGAINYFIYDGVFLLVLASLVSLIGIAWRVKLSQWSEY